VVLGAASEKPLFTLIANIDVSDDSMWC
jgi:hypothetical protein